MLIFIDTNVFFNNWFVSNADFKFLFNYLENTNSTLLLSELVCEEIDNLQNRGIQTIISNLNSEIKKAKKLNKTVPAFDFEQLNTIYSIKEILSVKTSNLKYITYNQIEQSTVVERALKQIKPFQEGEKGYRDTLIWLSFLKYLEENNVSEDVVFITNNKSDFYVAKERAFNPDLAKDISTHSINCRITPYDSLYSFVTEQALKAHHEFTYSELQEKYIDNVEDQIEDEVEWALNHLGNLEFKKLLDSSNKDFPIVEYIDDYSFEVDEGAEDGAVISYKKTSSDIIYVNFKFNLRRCAFRFVVSLEVYTAHRSIIERNYYNVEIDSEQVAFYSYIRPDFSISFNYYIESEVVSDLTIGKLRFM